MPHSLEALLLEELCVVVQLSSLPMWSFVPSSYIRDLGKREERKSPLIHSPARESTVPTLFPCSCAKISPCTFLAVDCIPQADSLDLARWESIVRISLPSCY